MAKLGDWERTVWRNRETAEEREESLLCRWRDEPTRQRLEYHYFEQFVQDTLGFEDLEEFIEALPEDEEDNFDAEHKYIIVYGENPEGSDGEPIESASTRSTAREQSADLMGGEYHPENLFPERYEVERPEIPDDLEETLDDDSDVEYEYQDIQELAKGWDIKANQGTEALVNALVEARDSEEVEAEA